jgi:hypothetical protein
MTRTLSVLALAAVTSLGAVGVDAQQAQPVTPGVIYQSGARITSPLSGITFSLPAGYAGQWDASAGAVIVQSPTPVIGGVWGWSEGTIEDVALAIEARLAELGIQLEPREAPTTTPRGLRGIFHAMTPKGPALLAAAVTQGPSGNVVAIAAMGAPEAESDLVGFLDAVSSSLEWTQPGASAWRSPGAGVGARLV